MLPKLNLHRSAVAGLLAVCATAAAASAHEIGTTRVAVDVDPGGRYVVRVVTDAATLLEKLEASDGSAVAPSGTDAAQLDRRLRALQETLRRRIVVAFDGVPAHPSVSSEVALAGDNAPPVATLTLSGQVPAAAVQFTWSYGWTFASYAFSAGRADQGGRDVSWLEGGDVSAPVALAALATPPTPPTRLATARQYLTLGFTHIVPLGFDHVLFVLGLYLLNGRWRSVLTQVSAFTLAHSITLGLSMYGLIAVSSRVVEPLIAASIAYVAIENLLLVELRSWRVALVFVFGLLHGLGFAGALRELGLPRQEFLTALLTFNLGVEGGQLAVVGAAFLLCGLPFASRDWYRQRVVMPASAAIACMAVYWTVQRLM